ncbi:MAG: DUF58 domain-containing protein [Thermoleophilia bacterium]|nr:DUF58 domain-containing protein [Thermoleophilia bacterium]MDH5333492.1 DUF58 domain-containing protein [Thermoleophilia bacterium]
MSYGALTFPLVPRRRLVGLAFGSMRGARRGAGTDVAGSRAYVPGDNPDRIDWAASGRLSSARGTDEFVVREHFADEAPRVVVVSDVRADMSLCPPELPWLRKDEAVQVACGLITDSVAEARGLAGFLEYGRRPGVVSWCAPGTRGGASELLDYALARDPADGVDGAESALEFLAAHRRAVPSASFVFVLSDFLAPPSVIAWEDALDRGWDVVPVVVQDPVWEQGFPSVDGIVLPLTGVDGRLRLVRLRPGESARLRAEHEGRREQLIDSLGSLGIEPVLLSSAGTESVYEAFLSWAAERQATWSRGV